jgi:O-acetyl-ADP-ribose deacetylase (regulator of RNase III)
VAGALGARSVAFPAISTGIFGYPRDLAADVAVDTLRILGSLDHGVERVVLVAYDETTLAVYERALAGRAGNAS